MHKTKALAVGLSFAALTGCAAQPTIDTGPGAEVSFDGLYKVTDSRADQAWALPGLDLSGYTKVLLQGAGVEWRPVKATVRQYSSMASRRGQTEFPVSEEKKERFRQIMVSAFLEELGKSEKFSLVTEPGPDVLLVRGALLDVVSEAPPERIGRGEIYISSVGEATLVLELRDSQSEAILARAIDRRAAEASGWDLQAANRVNNTSEVRRLAQSWARLLRTRLEEYIAD